MTTKPAIDEGMKQAFPPKLSCVKCGETDIHTLFLRKDEELVGYPRWIAAEKDCLKRYCRNCGYWWVDAPLDEQPVLTP